MKKNGLVLFLSFVLICLTLTGCNSNKEELYVYNWGDYISQEALDKFEEETGIKVIYELFDSNETMYAKAKASPTAYDVIFPSEYMAERMIKEGMLAKINWDKIPNSVNVDTRFLNTVNDPNSEYIVPYMWGTVGILYNKDLVSDPVTSWDILWNPKYSKQIFMYDSVRDTIGVSLKRLGYSLNTTDIEEINLAKEELIVQFPLVQAYLTDPVKDKMIGEEGALAVVYSGDAMYSKGENDSLEYVIPEEGSNVFYDGMVIPKGAKNVDNATKFIDFMCRGDIAALNTEYIGFSTTNIAALDLVSEDLRNSYIYNPSDEDLKRCEFFIDIGDNKKLYDSAWNEILTSK